MSEENTKVREGILDLQGLTTGVKCQKKTIIMPIVILAIIILTIVGGLR